ncbi:MAG: histidine--tRNA ligase, partial [Synechococcaceae bacterium WB5_2B_268]|nr:histidine--tRNA ligase [Synechococcaceae bacterium WB5_2B_268]
LLLDAPSLSDALGEESDKRFDLVKEGLSALQIPFVVNPRLVRGLDYYGHTAFEIISTDLGAQATVCGGGRYNGLVEQLGGPSTPCIGWAMGLERLVLLLKAVDEQSEAAPLVYVVSQGAKAESMALFAARELRQAGHIVELDQSGAGFSKQLKRAVKSGSLYALIIGETEAQSGQFQLKNLNTNTSRLVDQFQLIKLLEC